MVLKYSDKIQVNYGSVHPDVRWQTRFPSNAQPMYTAPISASRPIKLFEPTGKPRWGIHHLGGWKEVAYHNDSGGRRALRMNGNIISNAVAWASS